MKLPRRNFLHLAAGAAATTTVSRVARAQAYPSRPVHWIVGYTPGGGNDIFARLMGQWLQAQLGQPFVIENRPGAGSNIATEAVVRFWHKADIAMRLSAFGGKADMASRIPLIISTAFDPKADIGHLCCLPAGNK